MHDKKRRGCASCKFRPHSMSQLTEQRSCSAAGQTALALHWDGLGPHQPRRPKRGKSYQAFPPPGAGLTRHCRYQHKASSELLEQAIQATHPSSVPELRAGSPHSRPTDLPDEEMLAVKAAAVESRTKSEILRSPASTQGNFTGSICTTHSRKRCVVDCGETLTPHSDPRVYFLDWLATRPSWPLLCCHTGASGKWEASPLRCGSQDSDQTIVSTVSVILL